MSSEKQKEENAVPIHVPSGQRDDGKDRDEEEEKKQRDGEIKELHKGVEPFERHDKVTKDDACTQARAMWNHGQGRTDDVG